MNTANHITVLYTHDSLYLNVTVDRDTDGCVVERITVGADRQDISHLFDGTRLQSIADSVDAQLSRDARQHNAAARAERHQWHREFAIA